MFDVGWSELVVIGVVALVVIGPRDLPGALRTLGRLVGQVKRMASDFQGQFNEALREAELDGLRREVDDLRRSTRSALATPDIDALMRQPLSSQIKDEKPAAAPAAAPGIAGSDTAGEGGEGTAKSAANPAAISATSPVEPAAETAGSAAISAETATPADAGEEPAVEPHPSDLPVPPDPERQADFDKAEKRK